METSYEAYREPSVKAEPRWNERDDVQDRPQGNDSYRRRSPGPHDRRGPRGGRNRSRSPVLIDRYQPGDRQQRDDYYGHSRDFASRDREDRRRAITPPNIDRYVPGQDPALPPPVRINPLPNPLTLDYQVGFNWFAEWWRVEQSIKEDKERQSNGGRRPSDRASRGDPREEREKERSQIQVAYDAYKEELQAKMAKNFVQQHKTEEWFKERYHPETKDLIRRRLMDFRRGALMQWEQDLEAGLFDNFTLEGIYKNESNGAGGIVEREEGETVAAAEVLGVGDLVPSRGGDIRDESALQPALLIKTLAPMVSREKIESFCKEHLGEDDGGFKWLSLSDPNPQKKCHRIGWIMLHPAPDAETSAERGDGREEEDEMADVDNEAPKVNLLSTAEKALDAINGKTIYDEARGDFTCHVGVHIPPREPRKKALWDLFSAPERIERDLELAKRLVGKLDRELGPEADAVSKVMGHVDSLRDQGVLQPPDRVSNGVKRTKQSQVALESDGMQDLEEESEDEGEEEDEGAYDEELDDENLIVQKKQLDLLVEYLRRVYNFCLFCVFESDSVHELMRKCPGGHLRRPRASLSTAAKNAARASALGEPFPLKSKESNAEEGADLSPTEEKKFQLRNGTKNDMQLQRAFNWVKTFEDKILALVEPENADLKKLGGIPLEQGLSEELKKFVKQEDKAKFRCKVPECTKLFKGEDFWRKHVEKRHSEWYENIKTDIELVNTYVLDPSHIAPSRSDANSNGHFPLNNQHMPAGTPRGFNLSNMPSMNGFSGFPPATGFPGFPNFGNHAVQLSGSWAGGPSMMMEGADAMHSVGPLRKAGGRFQNPRSGPYDRRQPRYNGNGRQSPRGGGGIGMGGRMGGTSKWGDGAGAQAVGPREAVQGRSIKSYEDLDAVGGGAGSELNY